jgi:hypothetical protein
MAKALELSADTLTAQPIPKAAQIVPQAPEPRGRVWQEKEGSCKDRTS